MADEHLGQPGPAVGAVSTTPGHLARSQQVLTCSLVTAVLVAAFWAATGSSLAGWLLGLLLTGHAVVLALEMCLVAWVHGHDPAPRARLKQLLQAWWHEVWSAPLVFCWRQPFCSQRWADHLPAPAARPGRAGVLLVHGYVCNRGLWNPWLRRLRAAGVPFVAVNLEPVFGGIDDYAGRIEAAVQRLQTCTGQAPLVVCHSMGGLALRAWWALPGNRWRIGHVFTLATPHQGTWLARWGFTRNARQMRRGAPWLQQLAQREQDGRYTQCTCFYSHSDNIVFPASTATLPGATVHHLPACAHVQMANHPAPWQAVALALGLAPD